MQAFMKCAGSVWINESVMSFMLVIKTVLECIATCVLHFIDVTYLIICMKCYDMYEMSIMQMLWKMD